MLKYFKPYYFKNSEDGLRKYSEITGYNEEKDLDFDVNMENYIVDGNKISVFIKGHFGGFIVYQIIAEGKIIGVTGTWQDEFSKADMEQTILKIFLQEREVEKEIEFKLKENNIKFEDT